MSQYEKSALLKDIFNLPADLVDDISERTRRQIEEDIVMRVADILDTNCSPEQSTKLNKLIFDKIMNN